MRSSVLRALPLVFVATVAGACSSDFDTSRKTPKRGSVGRELYSLVCDRVGAQALREDVTASSYHGICHPDAKGAYWSHVRVEALPPITGPAYTVHGEQVGVETQEKNRAYRIARIEALGRHREELIDAFDSLLPDELIPVKDLGNPDPTKTCDPPADARAQKQRFLSELADTLSRLVDLYNDRTIPMFTAAIGRMMQEVERDAELQDALARIDARKGYRPANVAVGVVRPLFSYPRLIDLVNALVKVIASDSDPYAEGKGEGDAREKIPGKAAAEFQAMLRVLHEELRTAKSDPPLAPLAITKDAAVDRELLSRPRSTLEIARKILLAQDPRFGLDTTIPRYIVARDPRA